MPLSVGLFQCFGVDRKINWLMVKSVPSPQRCVIFFAGDISDFASANSEYRFSLEGLMWVLCCKYPNDTIILVKARMMVDFCAAYVNFIVVDGRGNPRPPKDLRAKAATQSEEVSNDHSQPAEENDDGQEYAVAQPPAVAHLMQLLDSLSSQTGEMLPDRLVLVGFSKGAVVLNALLSEPEKSSFWSRVESVHFVDAGLNVQGCFPVKEQALSKLRANVSGGFKIWLHGSPRQMEDPTRKFIAQEASDFLKACIATGVDNERRDYFVGLPPSLEMHFDVLRSFQTSTDDKDSGEKHFGFFTSWGACT